MSKGLILFLAPVLLANGFPADKYELAARFTGALVSDDLRSADQFLTSNYAISEWSNGPQSLSALAAYIKRCPIKSIEGNADHNININLNCADGFHGMSLEFDGSKIREIYFGPPPSININPEPSSVGQ